MPADNQKIQKDGSAQLVIIVTVLAIIILSAIIFVPLFGWLPSWFEDGADGVEPLEATETTEVVVLEGCDLAVEFADTLNASYLPKDDNEPVEIGLRLATGEDRLVINCLARLEDEDFDETVPYPSGVTERETVAIEATPFFTEASEPEIVSVQKLFIEDLEANLKTRWLIETVPNELIYVDVYNNGARLYDNVKMQFDYLAPADPSLYLEEIDDLLIDEGAIESDLD